MMVDSIKGFATPQTAAQECLSRLLSNDSSGWLEVLVQPQAEGNPYVSSGTLEAAILKESGARQPPLVWAMLRCTLKRMHRSEGTTFVVEGVRR